MSDDEAENITRLLRWVSVFIMIPALSISLAFLVLTEEWRDHVLHSFGFLVLGIAAIGLWFVAPRMAVRMAAEP